MNINSKIHDSSNSKIPGHSKQSESLSSAKAGLEHYINNLGNTNINFNKEMKNFKNTSLNLNNNSSLGNSLNINIQPVFSSNKKSLETINNVSSVKKNDSNNLKNKIEVKGEFISDKEMRETKDLKISSNILKNTIKSTKQKYNQYRSPSQQDTQLKISSFVDPNKSGKLDKENIHKRSISVLDEINLVELKSKQNQLIMSDFPLKNELNTLKSGVNGRLSIKLPNSSYANSINATEYNDVKTQSNITSNSKFFKSINHEEVKMQLLNSSINKLNKFKEKEETYRDIVEQYYSPLTNKQSAKLIDSEKNSINKLNDSKTNFKNEDPKFMTSRVDDKVKKNFNLIENNTESNDGYIVINPKKITNMSNREKETNKDDNNKQLSNSKNKEQIVSMKHIIKENSKGKKLKDGEINVKPIIMKKNVEINLNNNGVNLNIDDKRIMSNKKEDNKLATYFNKFEDNSNNKNQEESYRLGQSNANSKVKMKLNDNIKISMIKQNFKSIHNKNNENSESLSKNVSKLEQENSDEFKKKGNHVHTSSQPFLRPLVNINSNLAKEDQILNKKISNISQENSYLNKISTKEETVDFMNRSFESNISKLNENLIYQKESRKIKDYIKNYYMKYKEYPKTDINFYKIGRFLGKGAFGKVNLGLHVLTGRLVAIKSFNKQKIDLEKLKRKISFETNTLKSLYHVNVIKIFETYETDKFYMIAMEYISCGDLLSYVRKRSKLTEPIAKFIFKQIIKGLIFIHSKGIAHRDIKLDNILIDINSNIKLCDFGIAKKIKKGELMTDQCGTPAYIAPEVFKGNGYEGNISDMWSAGVVLYAMLAGVVPFKASKLPELQKMIIKGTYNKIKGISEEADDLISKLLDPYPNTRYTEEEVLNHSWMQFDENLIKNTLFTESEKVHLSNSNLDFRYADPKEICEVFTYKNLDTIVKSDNNKSKSLILAPFNSSLNDVEKDSFVNYVCDIQVKNLHKVNVEVLRNNNYYRELEFFNNIIKFDAKVKVINKIYEMNNNKEIDNGIIISPKGLSKNNTNESDKDEMINKKKPINSKIISKYNSGITSPVPEKIEGKTNKTFVISKNNLFR